MNAPNAATLGKPVYRIPTMTEIDRLPWNGFNVVSTFSGCGGSCLGYRMAGYRVRWANEFIPAARDTYKANHPRSILDPRDIRSIDPDDILKAIGLKRGELDLFDGSPPCAAFSVCGKREKGWGKTKKYSDSEQVVDDLFFEYARILKGLQPKVFVAENVAGLVIGKAKGYFLQILKELKSCGYNVKCKVLNAQYLGVPQNRERAIFIGVRNDLNKDPIFPRPLPYYYTIADALRGLKQGAIGKDDAYWINEATKVYKYWNLTNPGHSLDEVCKKIEGKPSFFSHKKLSPDLPCNTIVQARPTFYHWSEPRSLSIAEVKRVGGFPDDFILTGSFDQKWERIGRAVPPIMMSNIAKTIQTEILEKLR